MPALTVPDHRRPGFEGTAIPTPPIPHDDGTTSPELRRELDRLAAGAGSAAEVLRALSAARLFVPVVALLEEATVDGDGRPREKTSAMATVLVDSPEHGRALLAFSSAATLTAWRAEARPVAVMAALAARAAVSEAADALVVDVAGPTPFALAANELLLMASLAPAPTAGVDPVLARAVDRVVSSVPYVGTVRFGLAEPERSRPTGLWIEGVADESVRVDMLERLSRDRVVAGVTPDGLHVTFRDTP